MSVPNQKLSFREKAGYSLGDSSANFVFQALLSYQMFYYTNVVGISASAASWLFLLGRLWDAVTDPCMGLLADRTKTRWGRFRPWLIWSSVPFAIIFWITFTAPGWDSPEMKLVYAYVTYLLLMTIYTVNNVPYAALNGVMTADVDERTSLSTYRFVAVMATTLVVQGFTTPLVVKFGGHHESAQGWSYTFGIYAIIAFVFFIIAFFSAKERVQPDPNQKTSITTDLSDTFSNVPWRILFIATLLIFTMLAFRGGSLYYFFSYHIDMASLQAFEESLGLDRTENMSLGGRILDLFGLIINEDQSNVRSVGFGLFNMAGNLITILGVLASKPLSQRFGKKPVFITSLTATSFATAWLFFIPGDNATLLFIQGLTWAACYGPSIPLLWSMIADAADYSEWKYSRRATGLVFAGVVFALKAGLGIGGFLGARVLALHGFDAATDQTADSLMGIRLSATIYPALTLLAAAAIMLYYPISKATNYEMARQLQARRVASDRQG